MISFAAKKLLERHGWALFFVIVVGSLSVAPHFLAVHALGAAYKGYPFIYQANEDLYMGRIHDVIDGHPLVGSPMIYEYKNAWPPVLPVAEWIYALPTTLFHVPLTATIVGSTFLLPGVLFFLVYLLVLSMAHSPHTPLARWSAIGAGLLVALGYDIVDYAHLPALLTDTLGRTNLSVWVRPINPISGALFLFPLLIVVWKILTKETKWLFVLGGVLLGASISYFFSWFIGGSVVGLSLLYTLFQKKWHKSVQLAGVLALSLFLQIPYWYHSLMSLSGEAGRAIQLKTGAQFGHSPIINKFLLAITLVFLLCAALEFYKRKAIRSFQIGWIFCAILLLSCWVAYNEQIITGITVWPYHFVQYSIPISMVVLFVLGYNYVATHFPRMWMLSVVAAVAISLAIGISSARSYKYLLDDFLARQQYMQVFSWLNENSSPDCVVLADEQQEKLAMLIPAFTHCNTYMSSYIPFNVPDDRIMHNFLVLMRLHNLRPQEVREYLNSHPGEVNQYLFSSFAQELSSQANAETYRNIDAIVPAYQDFYKQNFADELTKYRLDYILSASSTLSNLPESASWHRSQVSSFYLYRLPQTNTQKQ